MDYLKILAVLPSILLGGFIYIKDKKEKEPTRLLITLFLCGIGSAILTLIVSLPLIAIFPIFSLDMEGTLFEAFIAAFIGVALIEETSKWVMVNGMTWHNKEFNHIFDAIVYSVFVSLGFATIENILYVTNVEIAVMRGLLSVPAHAFNGVFMGYYYGLAKQAQYNQNNKLIKKNKFMSLIAPILLHGTYDFLIVFVTSTLSTFSIIVFILFILIFYILSFRKVYKISKIQLDFNEINCPNCGTTGKMMYCSKCGTKIK